MVKWIWLNQQSSINMKKIVILLLIITVHKINAQVLTLDSVLSKVERNNPALLSFSNKISGAEARIQTARSWSNTTIGVQAGENPYSFDFENNTYQSMLFAEQWFPSGKRNKANEEYLKSISGIKKYEYEYMRNQFFANTKEAYYERYIAEKTIVILQNNIDLMQAMIDINERHLSGGMGDLSSIYKMKARLANTNTMLLHEKNLVRMETVKLNYFMNSDMNSNFEIDTNNLIKKYAADTLFYFLNDSIAAMRSDVLRTTQEITASRLNQKYLSTKSKPDFGLRFEHTAMFTGPSLYAAMFMMSVPIFSKSTRSYKSEIKALDFEITAMEQDRQAAINSINQMIAAYVLELNTEYAEIDNYLKNVLPAYKKSFDVSLLEYSQNTGDLMKALLAWDDLLMAQMEYLRHLGVLLKAQTDYEREVQIR